MFLFIGCAIFICLGIIYFKLISSYTYTYTYDKKNIPNVSIPTSAEHDATQKQGKRFKDWMDIATKLAALPPNEVIEQLNSQDPFGTRKFGHDLFEQESRLQRSLNMSELQQQRIILQYTD